MKRSAGVGRRSFIEVAILASLLWQSSVFAWALDDEASAAVNGEKAGSAAVAVGDALSANNDSDPKTNDQTLMVYSGFSNENDLLELVRLRFGRFEPYPIIGLAYRKEFTDHGYYQFEWGGNLVKHLESWELFELDALIAFRWKWAPWNRYLVTSLGIGEGLSFATGYPSSETVSQNIRSAILNFLWVDLRFSLPQYPEWALDFIIHHRSGIYGAIFGVRGGSNYICLGLTRRF